MKKVFWIFLFAISFLFVGCDSECKLEYTNAQGEKEQMIVSKTQDAETIAQVLGVLVENANQSDDFEAVKMNLKMNVDFAAKDSNGNSGSLTMNANSVFELNFVNYDFYASANFSFALKDLDTTTTMKANGKVYKESQNIYLDASYQEGSSKSVVLKYKMTLWQLLDMIEEIAGPDDIFPELGDVLPDLSTDEAVLEAIKEYNVAITSTSNSTITFKIELPIDESLPELKANLYIVWDTKIGSLKSMKIEDDTILKTLVIGKNEGVKVSKSKLLFELNFNYGNFKITTLNDSEKENFSTLPEFSFPSYQ
ncbi:MAG: hypothetical protein K2I42_00945 [Anaeroplasmataceae bacterium]|nr:hypothetical protein [Anaeroplasmataceae bacterium]